MRRTERRWPNRVRGFTLIEAVMVIAITGIVIGVVSIFIVPATTAYFASGARAQLGDQADTALRRIARDLSLALPNSARVSASNQSLELIPISAAARYAVDSAGALQFGVAPIPTFSIVGPPLKLGHASQQLAWYNLGAGIADADAYTLGNVRTATMAAGNASSVTVSGAALPNSLQAPPYRVYAIEQPVTYRCDTSTTPGTLTRYTGYGFSATQPDPPSGGTSAVLARNVSACRIVYDGSPFATRYGVVTLALQLTSQNETVSLYHTVHIDNLP
jgi:MSHA biogenesis protein MshO